MDTDRPSPSRLLRLPQEIRTKIYHFCFAGRMLPVSRPNTEPIRYTWIHTDDWGLVLSCKQLYNEALPECFRVAQVYCNRPPSALTRLSHLPLHRDNLRNLALEAFAPFPTAQELLVFPELSSVRMTHMRAFEPLRMGTRDDSQYDPLGHTTLLLSATQAHQIHWPDAEPKAQMKSLEDDLRAQFAKSSLKHHARPRFLLDYYYFYAEKIDHPDGWGGSTPKSTKEIEYNQTDNLFSFDVIEHGVTRRVVVRPNS